MLNHAVDPFAYAEKHVKQAVALADAPAHAERIAVAIEVAAEEKAQAETPTTSSPR